MADTLATLLEMLGYGQSAGYISASDFSGLKRHRFHLVQAAERMRVCGVLGLGTPTTPNFTPVVLVAEARDNDEARDIHRLAWSQGLCPFLLIATTAGVFVCSGFEFAQQGWGDKNFVSTETLRSTRSNPPDLLAHLTASKLRTSLAWQDKLKSIDGRVDEAMLADLGRAGDILVKDVRGYGKLSAEQANGLIGRILYLHFLISRDILNPSWLSQVGLDLSEQSRAQSWSPDWLWDIFDQLNKLLNGSIFPMSPEQRSNINEKHVNFIREVITHGARVSDYTDQLGLFRADLSVIRTETLSAIYEQFLGRVTSSADAKKGPKAATSKDAVESDGAFYTPPFLVDYLLDELELQRELTADLKIVDGSAGSGVFLVASYRRLIERELSSGQTILSHERLCKILKSCIFAIERNRDACHITAFSLYLTMLDYMTPEQIHAVIELNETGLRLFPSLVSPAGTNIQHRDIFDRTPLPEGFPRRFDIILGNPPWGSLANIRDSALARRFADRVKNTHHVGDDQIAELFFWRLTRWHLKHGGHAGLVMPLKSFVNKRSRQFVETIGRKMTITGFSNLSHMRRRLFRNAIHPALVVYVARDETLKARGTKIHSPILATQPIAKDRWLWTLTTDSSSIEVISETSASDPERYLHSAFVRKSVDRRIIDFLDDQMRHGKLLSIRDLTKFGLQWKSGDQERRTGLPENVHLTSKKTDPFYVQSHLVKNSDGWWHASSNSHAVPLSPSLLALAKGNFPTFFGGNVLAVPRSMEQVYRVAVPAAFNSSFNIFSVESGRPSSKELLSALAIYLESNALRYLAALNSRQMMIDRWVIELESTLDLPFPFSSPDDPDLTAYVHASKTEQEIILRRKLGIDPEYWAIIEEFFERRKPFSNGNIPEDALDQPSHEDIRSYSEMLATRLSGKLGSPVQVDTLRLPGSTLMATAINTEWAKCDVEFSHAAAEAYRAEGADIFTCSTFVYHDKNTDKLCMIKPSQRFYWTREHAYHDADTVDEALF